MRHLHEKCTRPTSEVIASTDPREEAIHDTYAGTLGRHEAPRLGHHSHERCLANECAFATHVGTGHQENRRRLVDRRCLAPACIGCSTGGIGSGVEPGLKRHVVGHQRAGGKDLFEHRMTTGLDQQFASCSDIRSHPSSCLRDVGQRHEHVEHGQNFSGTIQTAAVPGHK